MKKILFIVAAGLFVLLAAVQSVCAEAQEADVTALAKAAQNPISNMISLPFQNNFNFNAGPDKDLQYTLNIQPVIPFGLNKDWILITRTILPVIYQPKLTSEGYDKWGLGDINPSFFLSPTKVGKLIWGFGPTFTFPSATDDVLGSGKCSAGPAGVILTMQGPWVIGALVNNQWSYAGENDRKSVNDMLVQPFVNYNLPKGWYLVSSPIITANWRANNDNRWTVPVGGGMGKAFRIGKQPVNAMIATYYNVERPDGAADWQVRFVIQLIFSPKKK